MGDELTDELKRLIESQDQNDAPDVVGVTQDADPAAGSGPSA